MHHLSENIARELSMHFSRPVQIAGQRQVFGGDINQAFHLLTNAGPFFLKLHEASLKDMFQKEFEGLQILYQTQTIKIPAPVLEGNFGNSIFLVTEFMEKGNISKDFWQTFARQLAALHQHSNDQFGLAADNYIGSLLQQNTFSNSWSEFYAARRILPLLQPAYDQNKCSKKDLLMAENLCGRLPALFPEEKPSLLHGDLWSGNFMSTATGEPVIFDPAVYYGHREMDLAMSLLFGGFDKSFYKYYQEAFPLQPGWEQRVPLCQLYPLLVHLVLFGRHYYTGVLNVLKKYS